MDFERVSTEDDSNSSLLSHGSHNSTDFTKPHSRQREFKFDIIKTCLLVYCAISVTAMLAVAVAIFTQLKALEINTRCQTSYEFTAALGHNQALMSVDHKFDSLWDSEEVRENVVNLPDEKAGGKPLPGTISM